MDEPIELALPRKYEDEESGEARIDWDTLGTVWASVIPVRGGEPFADQQRYAEVTFLFRIWYRDDVTPETRITYEDAHFDIVEALPIGGRRVGLELRAKARAE